MKLGANSDWMAGVNSASLLAACACDKPGTYLGCGAGMRDTIAVSIETTEKVFSSSPDLLEVRT